MTTQEATTSNSSSSNNSNNKRGTRQIKLAFCTHFKWATVNKR